ncbi:hypothetical protein M3697_17355 [Janibacter melonis]|uniref:hypothetical protein n=1 Tax=Janibacter melonis TaxID=262209 RepID=UPI002043F34E|nr:hypothetical protein [Janibacter melonis]MCM3556850.1 hypothetical protein [Janibacter melonis]
MGRDINAPVDEGLEAVENRHKELRDMNAAELSSEGLYYLALFQTGIDLHGRRVGSGTKETYLHMAQSLFLAAQARRG